MSGIQPWPVVSIAADQPDGVVTALVEAADQADRADVMALGGFVQRAVAAAWAEDLELRVTLRPDGAVLLRAALPAPA